jgi:hypothetical protein
MTTAVYGTHPVSPEQRERHCIEHDLNHVLIVMRNDNRRLRSVVDSDSTLKAYEIVRKHADALAAELREAGWSTE